MAYKCKITVLRKECYEDLQEQYLSNPKAGPCPCFEVGQEIIVDKAAYKTMCDGKFCIDAWDSISKYVYSAIQGGNLMWTWCDEKTLISCCNDGTRPVVFKLERIEEAD